jgi:UDP-glucose 4-epimerase
VYKDQLPFVALRMYNVYGPGQDMSNLRQGMVSIFLAQAFASGTIEVKGNTSRFRDFIFIDDVVEAWFRSAKNPNAKNKVFNLGTGIKTTVGELLEKICNCVPGTEFYVKGSTPGDQNGIYADIYQIMNTLNLTKFTELDQGMPIFVDWARENMKK